MVGWCVKCDCGCDTCSGNRYGCTDCRGSSVQIGGQCLERVSTIPTAKFNSDWKSIDITYPGVGYFNGFKSSFNASSTGDIQAC